MIDDAALDALMQRGKDARSVCPDCGDLITTFQDAIAALRAELAEKTQALELADDNVAALREELDTALARAEAAPTSELTEAEIIELRDDCLPSQGEAFDCIAFARKIEERQAREIARLREESDEQIAADLELIRRAEAERAKMLTVIEAAKAMRESIAVVVASGLGDVRPFDAALAALEKV